jgi:hypothetical protein
MAELPVIEAAINFTTAMPILAARAPYIAILEFPVIQIGF